MQIDVNVHVHFEPVNEVLERFDVLFTKLGHMEIKIMAAIDDLKTAIAALIAEATADITTLINNAASNSSDPAMAQLAADVQTATTNLHNQFIAATGTPVPAPSA